MTASAGSIFAPERIKELLIETDYTIEHIASLVGIEHMQRLYQLFKKRTGLTPAEFRARNRENS